MRSTAPHPAVASRRSGRGYTLIELLVIVVVLGIAGAMVIPSMTQAGALRIHAAVRSIVADLTFAQADAAAFQERRVVYFNRVALWDQASSTWTTAAGNGYTLYAPPLDAATIDLNNDVMFDPYRADEPYSKNFDEPRYGGAKLLEASFEGGAPYVVFDELGGVAQSLTGDAPGAGGFVRVGNDMSEFTISVDAFTGRITVADTGP
ncbi:MAG: type II secretion system protein [Planctomycetota bacterium]|nr:MAG: type II secretion system protein [Planctomycetota bacterium]